MHDISFKYIIHVPQSYRPKHINAHNHKINTRPQCHTNFNTLSYAIANTTIFAGTTAVVAAGSFCWLLTRYKISDSNQYLVRTGLFIPDILISKTGFLWPFQKYKYLDMTPQNYSFNLHAMSSEKIEFILPCSFLIGVGNTQEQLKSLPRYLAQIGSMENDASKS